LISSSTISYRYLCRVRCASCRYHASLCIAQAVVYSKLWPHTVVSFYLFVAMVQLNTSLSETPVLAIEKSNSVGAGRHQYTVSTNCLRSLYIRTCFYVIRVMYVLNTYKSCIYVLRCYLVLIMLKRCKLALTALYIYCIVLYCYSSMCRN
jgi:hypothetical protein